MMDDDDRDEGGKEEGETGGPLLASNEREVDIATSVKELPGNDGDDDVDAIAVGPAPLPSRLRAEKPQVCSATASFDVISNVGVFPKSSPAKFSSCIWQIPLL